MLRVDHLFKHFRVAQPGRGIRGKLRRLVKPEFKVIQALDDVSFEIGKGEIVGYLGPNGAGKSTTIKLLTGVLVPTSGSIEVNGLIPFRQRTANAYNIGVVYGQRTQLWWDLPLVDSFEAIAAMYRIPRARYRTTLDFLVELLELEDLLDQPAQKLSLGQRMKGDLAAVLLHEPPILYLDEPTLGLDVLAKNTVLQFLETLSVERGTTILFTSHNLSDVERLCPRIIILDHGRVILDATREAILSRFGRQRRLVVEFTETIGDIEVPLGEIVQQEANKLWIAFDREVVSAFDLIGALGQAAQVNGNIIKDISIEEPDIESIVGQIYRRGTVTPEWEEMPDAQGTGGR